jgi:hypothetical protein
VSWDTRQSIWVIEAVFEEVGVGQIKTHGLSQVRISPYRVPVKIEETHPKAKRVVNLEQFSWII